MSPFYCRVAPWPEMLRWMVQGSQIARLGFQFVGR